MYQIKNKVDYGLCGIYMKAFMSGTSEGGVIIGKRFEKLPLPCMSQIIIKSYNGNCGIYMKTFISAISEGVGI
jgi:hypothetical protein